MKEATKEMECLGCECVIYPGDYYGVLKYGGEKVTLCYDCYQNALDEEE